MSLLHVTDQPLSAEGLAAETARAAGHGEGCGAVTVFLGLVRATHEGREVAHLEYEAYAPLALTTFAQIQQEVADAWPGVVVGIAHRTGRLAIGEASVVIAAASAHRAPSFEVCRYAIERVKQIAPVWKHEYFVGGSAAWVEGALADPADPTAKARARRCACASA